MIALGSATAWNALRDELEALRIGPRSASLLKFRPFERTERSRLRRLFWAFPVFRTAKREVAIRLAPGIDLMNSPVVISNGKSAITLATRWRDCWPLLVLHLSLGTQPGSWQAWRMGWEDMKPSLESLIATIGGPNLTLLHDVVFDDDIVRDLSAPPLSNEQNRGFMAAAVRLDPHPAHVAYRTSVQRMLEGAPIAPSEDRAELGPWRQAYAMAAYLAAWSDNVHDAKVQWAWRLHRDGDGIDYLGPLRRAIQLPSHRGASVGPTLAAQDLCQTSDDQLPWRRDRRARCVERLCTEGSHYTGRAHYELALELARDGELVASWDALGDAAFYAAIAEADAQAASAAYASAARDIAATADDARLSSWLESLAEP